jgi:hypothetical protein
MTVNEEVLDALLSASRVMVSLAARSLADIDSEVTLSHYRALVAPARPAGHRIVLLVRRTAVVVGAAPDRQVREMSAEHSDGDGGTPMRGSETRDEVTDPRHAPILGGAFRPPRGWGGSFSRRHTAIAA